MIVADRFVFLHLHKSGGTFANECILRFVPDAHSIGYHLPRRMLPPAHANKPMLGLVRNPWSYYVSWYAFQAAMTQPNPLFRILSDERKLGFEGTIRNMVELGNASPLLKPLQEALPPAYGTNGLNLPGFALAPIAQTGLGFYSFLYHYLYDGEGAPAHIATMERMREDLPALLENTGYMLPADMRAFIAREAPRNTSQHAPYQSYYGAALRDLVAERDADVIRLHGYKFQD
jgi:hypothetical protein